MKDDDGAGELDEGTVAFSSPADDSHGPVVPAVHDALRRRTQETVNVRTGHDYWDTDKLPAEVFPDGRLRIYVYPDAFALVPSLLLEYDDVDADTANGKRYFLKERVINLVAQVKVLKTSPEAGSRRTKRP